MRLEHDIADYWSSTVCDSFVKQNGLERVSPEVMRTDRRQFVQNQLYQGQERLVGIEQKFLGFLYSLQRQWFYRLLGSRITLFNAVGIASRHAEQDRDESLTDSSS